MKKVLLVSFTAVGLLLQSGCSQMTVLRVRELQQVQNRVDSLHSELTTMQTKMLQEQKNQTEMLRLMRADQQVKFSELDAKVSSIEGNLSENQTRLSQIGEKTEEFQKRLEAKLSSDSLAQNSKDAEIQKLFQIAMSDFNAGRYDIAINGFKDLSTQYPDADQAQEAEYWIAECLNAKKDIDAAQKAYIAYIKKYPAGPKVCVSLYKLGLNYDKQNQDKSKSLVWEKLVKQCPDSPEAQMIKARTK